MDHEQTMGVNSRVLDQKQQNIFGRISRSMEVQGQLVQLQHLLWVTYARYSSAADDKNSCQTGVKGHRTVQQYTEAHCFSGDLDVSIPHRNRLELKLRQLVWCTKPTELKFCPGNFNRLAHIHWPISSTQLLHITVHCRWVSVEIELRVVGKWVHWNPCDCSDITTVDEKKDRTEHASLRHTAGQWRSRRLHLIEADWLHPVT